MAVLNQSFTTEERVAQLRACCETIIEKAEEIMKDIDLTTDRIVSIEFMCRELPEIRVENRFLSKNMIDIL